MTHEPAGFPVNLLARCVEDGEETQKNARLLRAGRLET